MIAQVNLILLIVCLRPLEDISGGKKIRILRFFYIRPGQTFSLFIILYTGPLPDGNVVAIVSFKKARKEDAWLVILLISNEPYSYRVIENYDI